MSRRHRAEKREIFPDPKFGDEVISKFMNNLMKEVRSSIDNNDFDNAKKKWLNS